MPSTYTLNNGIELIATGEQSGTWGDTTNTNLSLVDTALDGQVTVTLPSAGTSGSPNTLAISDGAASDGRNRMVIFNDGGDLGATAYVQLTPNDAEKIIYVRNDLAGSRSIILFQGTYNASNDYELPAGTTAVVYFDGAGSGAVAANVFNNAYFDSLRLGSVSVTAILDEDNMASDSATALATQQSIKAYVDTQVGANNELSEVLANGNTTGGTDISVSSGDDITFADSSKAIFGAGSDLQIYHDGSDSFITDTGAGNLQIWGGNFRLRSSDGSEAVIDGNSGGAVTLYYDNSPKLATTSTGITVTGSGVFSNSTDVAQSFAEFGRTPFSTHGSLLVSGTGTGHLTSNTDASGNSTVNVGATRIALGNGELDFYKSGSAAAGAARTFSRTMGIATNGDITFYDTSGNASFVYDESAGSTFNENGDNKDFRVESDNNANALFVDASTGTVSFGTSLVSVNGTDPVLRLNATNTGGGSGNPQLEFYRDSALYGSIEFIPNVEMRLTSHNAVGSLNFHAYGDNQRLSLGSSAVFNEPGNDYDFRVESDNQTHMLFVDAGNDRVAIGQSANFHGNRLNIEKSDSQTDGPEIVLKNLYQNATGDDELGSITFGAWRDVASSGSYVASIAAYDTVYPGTVGELRFYTRDNGTDDPSAVRAAEYSRLTLKATATVFNEAGADTDFRVESDNNANMLFVDAGADHVSIGTGEDRGGVLNVESSDNNYTVMLSCTDDDNNAGPWLGFDRRTGSAANNDNIGSIAFLGRNSAAEQVTYSEIRNYIDDVTDGTEDGIMQINVLTGGSTVEYLRMAGGFGSIFNEGSADVDFRVESDNNANMLFVDAGNDSVQIGKGDGNVATTGCQLATTGMTYSASSGNTYHVYDNGTGPSYVFYVSYGGVVNYISLNQLSDRREKENIVDLPVGLEAVKQLRPRQFDWIKENQDNNVYGFIAQEVEEVLPNLVNDYMKDEGVDRKGLKHIELIAVLTKAMQEQQTIIETLEARITALENA